MNYWLVKSEPNVYSWQRFVKEKRAVWDGVRNYEARNNLRRMQVGDEVFFYHSNIGQEIVGMARVVRQAYPDPTQESDTWSAVDLVPMEALRKTISLAELKLHPTLKEMILVRRSRLSVMPVTKEEHKTLLALAAVK